MNNHEYSDRVCPGRALWALVFLFGGALLLGLLLAPPVFHGLLFVGRTVPGLEELRNLEFGRVANRCVLACLIFGVWPAARFGRLRPATLGYRPGESWWRPSLLGWMAGVVSIFVLYAVGWRLGAYHWAPRTDVNLAVRVLGFLAGGWMVGVIEETIFRGWMFGMMRRVTGFIAAATLSSVLFSAVHFISPDPPLGVVHAPWHAGLSLLPHAFGRGGVWADYVPYALTLFVMGLLLCTLWDYSRRIYFIIGLHAGWVVVLQSGRYVLDRDPDPPIGWFGQDVGLAYAPVTFLMVCAWLAGAWYVRRRRR